MKAAPAAVPGQVHKAVTVQSEPLAFMSREKLMHSLWSGIEGSLFVIVGLNVIVFFILRMRKRGAQMWNDTGR